MLGITLGLPWRRPKPPARAPQPGTGQAPAQAIEGDRLEGRQRARDAYPPLLRPMPGVVTQGVRPGHPALDIACNVGTPVRAAHDGQGRSRSIHTHGLTFELRRGDGLVTSYSHLSAVKPGGAYKRGDLIGACGNTGTWTTGPHLHFESNRPELLNALSDK